MCVARHRWITILFYPPCLVYTITKMKACRDNSNSGLIDSLHEEEEKSFCNFKMYVFVHSFMCFTFVFHTKYSSICAYYAWLLFTRTVLIHTQHMYAWITLYGNLHHKYYLLPLFFLFYFEPRRCDTHLSTHTRRKFALVHI